MKNANKIFLLGTSKYMRMILSVLMLSSMFIAPAMADNSIAGNVVSNLCQLLDTVKTVIFIIGLALMILGGALYAASHVMPGQSKGTVQGYGMGMVLGGVIGVIIAVVMPYLFSLIGGATASNAISGC